MIFTSEQVSCGHPDKICDQISDAIVTACLSHDRNSRVAAECMIKDYEVIIAGEITSSYEPDYKALVTEVLSRIGLSDPEEYRVTVYISKQSQDIALGVDGNSGAGDQGMMFGYATDETPEMLPIPYAVATHALQILRELKSPLLLPDAKAQVSYDYDTGRITTFLISTQHREDTSVMDIRPLVEAVMETAAQDYDLNTDFEKLVNPTGRFVVGSSFADSGLTGRKIIADTTVVCADTAAVRSLAKTLPRLIEVERTWQGKSQRTSSVLDRCVSARCSWHTPSAWLNLCPWQSSALVLSVCPLVRLKTGSEQTMI